MDQFSDVEARISWKPDSEASRQPPGASFRPDARFQDGDVWIGFTFEVEHELTGTTRERAIFRFAPFLPLVIGARFDVMRGHTLAGTGVIESVAPATVQDPTLADALETVPSAPAEIDKSNFVELLLRSVPELQPTVDQHFEDGLGELLLHLLMADVLRFTKHAFESGSTDEADRVLGFVATALGAGDESVVNAVQVSFVEDARWWSDDAQAFIAIWPEELRAEADRQRRWSKS